MQLASTPRTLLLTGTVLVLGGYLYARDDASAQVSAARVDVIDAPVRRAHMRAELPPRLPDIAPPSEVAAVIIEDEPVRGHALIDDPAEFAMVFSVDGVSYLRLSEVERASSRGAARMIRDEAQDLTAVVADVTTAALPAELRAWSGREVFVEGTCRARVVGFAEVSRAIGGSEGAWTEADGYTQGAWTIESLRDANLVLAARLDGCNGTWARAESYPAAAVATRVDSVELAREAERALLAERGADDPRQREWVESGGEGRWQDAVEVTTDTFEHPLTGERWVFARAANGGHCGDPSVAAMTAYRAGSDGTLHRMTDLPYAYSSIDQAVDLDGDGQLELVLGGGDSTTLVDLAGEHHQSIYVPSYAFEGCGC